jgi:hypothetical protein
MKSIIRPLIVSLVIAVGIANAARGSILTEITMRRIIEKVDHYERMLKPVLESDIPAGTSARYQAAWYNMLDKARDLNARCEDVSACAERIAKDDESQEAVEMLSRAVHEFVLAANVFDEAFDQLRRTPRYD